MRQQTRLSFLFVVLTALFTALVAPACSSSPATGSSPEVAELQGVYYAKDPGPYAWVAFLSSESAVLFSSAASCQNTKPAGSCYATGPYTFDAGTGALQVTDFRTGQTTSLQVGVLSVDSTLSARLALDDVPGDSLTSGSGSLTSQAGALATPAKDISITSSSGSQQLTGSGSKLASACSTIVACVCALVIAITPLEIGGGINPEEPVEITQPVTECKPGVAQG